MQEENKRNREEQFKQQAARESKERIEDTLGTLMGMEQMFQDFIAAETEGMIVCENCYDNVFDDDENICQCEDFGGNVHVFCSKECMDEWMKRDKIQEG